MSETHRRLEILRDILREIGSVVVAYSGGVDSTFLLKVCLDTLGKESVLAVTATSATYPGTELEEAKRLAASLGAGHRVIRSEETEIPEFVDNPPNRCYYCKWELFSKLSSIAKAEHYRAVTDGTNYDDLSDHRAGLKAAQELGIKSPLAEAKLGKAEIRKLSREMNLPTWSKPSFACLSSRFPYGQKISHEGLLQVEKAEAFLHELGFRQVRVRHHSDTARIEVEPTEIGQFVDPELARSVVERFKSLGFTYVALDLQGYRTGSMNELLGKCDLTPNKSKPTPYAPERASGEPAGTEVQDR